MKKKKNWEILILFMIPIIDFLSFINPFFQKLNLTLKSIFFLYAIFYLLKNREDKKIFITMGIYFAIYFSYIFTNYKNSLEYILLSFKIFSLPIIILFFSHYENEKITNKTIAVLSLVYLFFYFLGIVLSVKFSIHLFSLFILLISISGLYLTQSKSYLLSGVYFFLFLILAILINAKSFYLSILIILIYYININGKEVIRSIKKNHFKINLK